MKIKTISALIGGGILMVAVAATILYSPVIFQRGNPIPYLSAISKLDSNTTYAQVNVDDNVSVYISHKGTCEELLDYISVNSNFELQEQAGGAYIFSNGTDKLIVTSEIYFGRYTVYEVPNTEPDA